MSQFSGYSDWYREGALAASAQSHRTLIRQEDRSIPAGQVTLINVSPPAGAVVEPPLQEYALHLLLQSAPLLRVGFNRRPRWLAVSPGSMILAPPDTCCEYIADAAAHVLTAAIPKSRVEEFEELTGARVEVRGEEAFRHPALERNLIRLWQELSADAPAARLRAHDVGAMVLDALATRRPGRSVPPATRERLTTHTLRRVCDYVEIRLADDLDVPGLAAVAGLSPAHFARAFTATTGMTPFRYVMTRRLARARERLERSNRPVLDIALDLGFKTPSHFAARFHREFGVPPRAVRRGRQMMAVERVRPAWA